MCRNPAVVRLRSPRREPARIALLAERPEFADARCEPRLVPAAAGPVRASSGHATGLTIRMPGLCGNLVITPGTQPRWGPL